MKTCLSKVPTFSYAQNFIIFLWEKTFCTCSSWYQREPQRDKLLIIITCWGKNKGTSSIWLSLQECQIPTLSQSTKKKAFYQEINSLPNFIKTQSLRKFAEFITKLGSWRIAIVIFEKVPTINSFIFQRLSGFNNLLKLNTLFIAQQCSPIRFFQAINKYE